jgi:hypothetical protein
LAQGHRGAIAHHNLLWVMSLCWDATPRKHTGSTLWEAPPPQWRQPKEH